MLSPEYLDTLPDALVELWQQVEDDILRDIARRIAKLEDVSDMVQWQAWRLQQIRAIQRDVVEIIARSSGKSKATIRTHHIRGFRACTGPRLAASVQRCI